MLGPGGKPVNPTPTLRDRWRGARAGFKNARSVFNNARSVFNNARSRLGLRPFLWGGILALLALALDFVPLYDLLGYDFAFAIGFGASLAGVDIGQGVMARTRARLGRAPAGGELARVFGQAAALSAATLVLPLLFGLANAARVRNCSLSVGLAFFALLPLGSALFAATAGVLAGLTSARPRRGRLLAFALPVLSILWTLLRLYRDPPVFAFDPFGGYFPGPIYDEALRPPLSLVLFRSANVVWAATAILLALAAVGRGRDPRRWRPGATAAALPLLVASIVLYGLGGRLGFHITHDDLGARARPDRDHLALRRPHHAGDQEPHRAGAADRGSRSSATSSSARPSTSSPSCRSPCGTSRTPR